MRLFFLFSISFLRPDGLRFYILHLIHLIFFGLLRLLEVSHFDVNPTLGMLDIDWIWDLQLLLGNLSIDRPEVWFLFAYTFLMVFIGIFLKIFFRFRFKGLFGLRQSLDLFMLSLYQCLSLLQLFLNILFGNALFLFLLFLELFSFLSDFRRKIVKVLVLSGQMLFNINRRRSWLFFLSWVILVMVDCIMAGWIYWVDCWVLFGIEGLVILVY